MEMTEENTRKKTHKKFFLDDTQKIHRFGFKVSSKGSEGRHDVSSRS